MFAERMKLIGLRFNILRRKHSFVRVDDDSPSIFLNHTNHHTVGDEYWPQLDLVCCFSSCECLTCAHMQCNYVYPKRRGSNSLHCGRLK